MLQALFRLEALGGPGLRRLMQVSATSHLSTSAPVCSPWPPSPPASEPPAQPSTSSSTSTGPAPRVFTPQTPTQPMGPKMPASHKAYGMEYLPPPRPLTKLYQVAQPPAVSWRRHVIRFPPGVEVSMARDVMTLSGKTGTLEVDLKRADPQGALAFQLHELSGGSGSGGSGASAGGAGGAAQQAAQPSQQPKSYLLFLASPMQKGGFFHPAVRRIENAISGVTQGFLVGLTLKGVGYRMEPVDALRVGEADWYWEAKPKTKPAEIAFPHTKPCSALRLKIGFARNVVYPLPQGVIAFLVKPTLAYLYGLDLEKVKNTAMRIRRLRKPNAYTGQGIQLVGETVRLKAKKGKGKSAAK